MADVFPVDYSSDVGRVRKYIPDVTQLTDPKNPSAPASFLWSDDEIQSFVDDQTDVGFNPTTLGHIYRAAADIMVATANNEALILKKLVTEDLQTDGPAVANALLKSAALFYGKADELDSREVELFIAVPYEHVPPRYDWR